MDWINIGNIASEFVLRSFNVNPNKVQEVKTDAYINLPVLFRDDGMVAYGSNANGKLAGNEKNVFEIVLHRPHSEGSNTSFSIYRSSNQPDITEKFGVFANRLSAISNIAKTMCTVNGLQKISDTLIENPSWTIAHLVAYFNLTECVSHPKVFALINQPDYEKDSTPLQLAIKCGHLKIVKSLIQHSDVLHLDNTGNSVYHYASITTPDMINLLTSTNVEQLNHCNSDGYTPLHLACLADKPECVKALLMADADVNIEARHNSRNITNSTVTANIATATMTSSTSSTSNTNPTISCNVSSVLQNNSNKLLTQYMKDGGTPLHWSSSGEVLQELIDRGCNINALNFCGRTALHMMVDRNRLDCVVNLVSNEAEIDLIDDNGDTALHIAIEKNLVSIVQCLVVFGCDVNIKNRKNNTPLHMVSTKKSNVTNEILYVLHSVGANRCPPSLTNCPMGCNAIGEDCGIPPIKPETPEQREHMDEVLATTNKSNETSSFRSALNSKLNSKLGFNIIDFSGSGSSGGSGGGGGACSSNTTRTSILSPQSPTPKEIVDTTIEQHNHSIMDSILGMFSGLVKAESIPKVQDNGQQSATTTPTETTAASTSLNKEKTPKSGRVLCMDGGGIRGLVLIQMLLEIEKLTQTPIHHLFDWIAGTSTGGILALAIGCGNTMRQCMCIYIRMKNQVFVGSRPYSSENFEKLLKDNLGEYSVMSDIKFPKIMVTAVMAERKPVDLHLFRNYESPGDLLGFSSNTVNATSTLKPLSPDQQLIWGAARATGAAPLYFRSFGSYLDGGLIANNPTLDAMTEIQEYNRVLRVLNRETEAVPISVVVSLGTGLIPVTQLKGIDIYRPDSIWEATKLASTVASMTLLIDQATATNGAVVDRARAWCSTIDVPYYRFNPPITEDIPMDEKNDQKLIYMLWETKAYMYKNRNKVIELISSLK